MKSIYTKENIEGTIRYLQKRFNNIQNKKYTLDQITYAFNKLPGKYQDLLLKNNKDENDKANLTFVYNNLKKLLVTTKNIPSNIEIQIKNIDQEPKETKRIISMEDIDSDKDVETRKKHEKKKEETKPQEINYNEQLNERLKIVLIEEYISERQGLDIEKILDELDLEEDKKYIIMLKYDNNLVKTNEELSSELGLKEDYIDDVVDTFLDTTIEHKKSKLLSLERK